MTKAVVDMKKAAKRLPQDFMAAAQDFENSKIDEIKLSRKIAWWIAGVCVAITSVSILAFLVALLTRPEPVPTIIKVDQSTGESEVVRAVKDAQEHFGEVVDKHWLAVYVRLREGYDWYEIGEQFDAVKLMSEGPTGDEYAKAVQAVNAPLKVYKDKAKVKVHIEGVAFVGQLAQVRFTTEKVATNGENTDGSPPQKYVATIAYHYNSGLMTDQQRLINPLGFRVLTYRVDAEAVK